MSGTYVTGVLRWAGYADLPVFTQQLYAEEAAGTVGKTSI